MPGGMSAGEIPHQNLERVDLMRDRRGYISDREIGQHLPLQRVYSSATLSNLDGGLPDMAAIYLYFRRRTTAGVFCLGEDRQSAMPSLAARKVDFTQGRLLPTPMPVMSSVDRKPAGPAAGRAWMTSAVLSGFNGTLYPAFAVPSADNRFSLSLCAPTIQRA